MKPEELKEIEERVFLQQDILVRIDDNLFSVTGPELNIAHTAIEDREKLYEALWDVQMELGDYKNLEAETQCHFCGTFKNVKMVGFVGVEKGQGERLYPRCGKCTESGDKQNKQYDKAMKDE